MIVEAITIHDDGSYTRSQRLRDSLVYNGWQQHEFLYGFIFGRQYDIILEFIKQYKGDATHFVYNDAFDVICFASPKEVINKFKAMDCKMLISAEKACFPFSEKAVLYPQTDTAWKYINGGGSMFEIDYFVELTKKYPFESNYIDPDWLLKPLLDNPNEIKLDNYCQIFQPIAHSQQNEWQLQTNGRYLNVATQTKPVFFHGNGRTDMSWMKIK